MGDFNEVFPGFDDRKNSEVNLLWISCGKADRFLWVSEKLRIWLQAKRILNGRKCRALIPGMCGSEISPTLRSCFFSLARMRSAIPANAAPDVVRSVIPVRQTSSKSKKLTNSLGTGCAPPPDWVSPLSIQLVLELLVQAPNLRRSSMDRSDSLFGDSRIREEIANSWSSG
jgi:hypothetical protein